MAKVFVTYKIPDMGLNLLKEKFEVIINPYDRLLTKDELIKAASNFDALITMLADTIDKDVLESGKDRLKIVANYAVGYNNIDFEKAKELGIYVTNTPGVLTETTADLAWALMLAISRRIVESDAFTRSGKFEGWKPELFLGNDVYGKILGIIGFGNIGQAVARRAIGFNMKVYYYQRHKVAPEIEKSLHATYLSLEEVLTKSDFISLHVPLTKETYHLIDFEEFKLMKNTAVFINVSRGQTVNEVALIDAIKSNKIFGAGLDVYEKEPISLDNELINMPNVVTLPHIGTATQKTQFDMAMVAAKNLVEAACGKSPENVVKELRDL